MSKQRALDQAARQGGAVKLDQRAIFPIAAFVNRSRHQLLGPVPVSPKIRTLVSVVARRSSVPHAAAFGVADNSDMTVMSLLLATNNFTDIDGAANNDDDGYSHVYDANGDGILDADELALRAMANDIYSFINEEGDI